MRNREWKRRIATAVEHATPDVLSGILSSCDEQKGTVIPMTEIVNKKKHTWRYVTAIAAAFALCIGLFGFLYWRAGSVDSLILLDVNPSLSISVNAREKVLEVTPLNDDARTVIGEMDLKGTQLDVAVNALIGSMLQNGYLSDLQNSILVSIENDDQAKSAQLQAQITAAIDQIFQSREMSGAVLSQTVTEDAALTALAQQYGISVGKAALIQEVISQDATLTFDTLAPLSVNEIALISSSKNLPTDTVTQTGAASDKAYIGQDAAIQAAYAHAGATAADVLWSKAEFDSDDGRIVYEVEFATATIEYEYDIDARTGDVVKYEQEMRNTGTVGADPSAYIGQDAAQNAAFAHAGVSGSQATVTKLELDRDDGVAYYEVDFRTDSAKYEYEIDAVSGAVRKVERHVFSNTGSGTGNGGNVTNPTTSTTAPTTPPVSSTYIGDAAAIATALGHAGVSESQVRELKCEFDWDDGRAVYEVEFESGRYEYEYEIDALSGTILQYEIDD